MVNPQIHLSLKDWNLRVKTNVKDIYENKSQESNFAIQSQNIREKECKRLSVYSFRLNMLKEQERKSSNLKEIANKSDDLNFSSLKFAYKQIDELDKSPFGAKSKFELLNTNQDLLDNIINPLKLLSPKRCGRELHNFHTIFESDKKKNNSSSLENILNSTKTKIPKKRIYGSENSSQDIVRSLIKNNRLKRKGMAYDEKKESGLNKILDCDKVTRNRQENYKKALIACVISESKKVNMEKETTQILGKNTARESKKIDYNKKSMPNINKKLANTNMKLLKPIAQKSIDRLVNFRSNRSKITGKTNSDLPSFNSRYSSLKRKSSSSTNSKLQVNILNDNEYFSPDVMPNKNPYRLSTELTKNKMLNTKKLISEHRYKVTNCFDDLDFALTSKKDVNPEPRKYSNETYNINLNSDQFSTYSMEKIKNRIEKFRSQEKSYKNPSSGKKIEIRLNNFDEQGSYSDDKASDGKKIESSRKSRRNISKDYDERLKNYI